MARLANLPSMRSTTQRARNFYTKCNAMPLYSHCMDVMEVARKTRILEGQVITDERQSWKRRMANFVVGATILTHVIDNTKVMQNGCALPKGLGSDEVMEENRNFCDMTALERRSAPLTDFVPILNNGHAPLALLVKLADYAVTHNKADYLEGLVGAPSYPIFRTYRSRGEAYRSYRTDAKAGELIYAPVAELFGYPGIAGTILKHSYAVTHPDVHKHVMKILGNEVIRARLGVTQKIAKDLKRILKTAFASYGFDVGVEMRPVKSEGKLMRKTHRLIREDFEANLNGSRMTKKESRRSLEKFMKRTVGNFDGERIHDWVALRIIVKKYNKRDINSMGSQDRERIIGIFGESDPEGEVLDSEKSFPLAVKIVNDALSTYALATRMDFGDVRPQKKNKKTGYKAYHWDLGSQGPAFATNISLPFEVQLKTQEWHEVAEHGKAAHYYYVGGEPEFIDTIAAAYKDIIYRNLNGNKRQMPSNS
ncbi:hypothetical protein GF318_05655 [Candidatus Micrarchaeota archaeon]|nr:hypothetical protein [Candidatus Micrarchaeota archaeon]